MGTATPRWSDVQFSYATSAFRAWDVVARDEADALASSGIIPSGGTHPLDRSLIADPPDVKADGFGKWIVSSTFKPAGQQNDRQKARIRWRRGTSSQQFDRDPHGNPLLNSALDLLDPPQEKEVAERFFSIVRQEAFYDLAKAEAFEDTTNDADFTFLGRYPFKKGQVRCEAILPTGEYPFDATLIEVEYAFAFRRDGWKWRIVDQGRKGWYLDATDNKTKKSEIFASDGTQVSSDVRLDGGGAPFDFDHFKVGRAGTTPVNIQGPKGATVEKGDAAAFLVYDKFLSSSFAGLEL